MSDWISTADHGHSGQPGDYYTQRIARVKNVGDRFELYVRSARGSNQGSYEEHARTERRYRANDLEDLMKIGISEVRGDTEFNDQETSQLVSAIREVIFEAQDME